MKRLISILAMVMLLSGCGQPKAFETMLDTFEQPPLPQAREVFFHLPEDAAKAVLQDPGAGTLYLCDDYVVTIQTLPAGDLDATLREVTGYGREKVQLWERKDGIFSRYLCVWASAGEGGDQMCKATILDDGNYHYVLSVMAPAADAGELADIWKSLMDSFSIVP